MKQAMEADRSRNNNTDNFYFPEYTVTKSIDYLTLSCIHPKHEKLIDNFLKANCFHVLSDLKLEKGNFNKIRTYKCGSDEARVEIFHWMKQEYIGPRMLLMRVHDPKKELTALLQAFFQYHGVGRLLSKVELTFDFETERRADLYEFLRATLYEKHNKSGTGKEYQTTFYTGKKDRVRVYFKTKGNGKFVRLELILHRRDIRRLGLDFPLSNIDDLDLSSFFQFSRIDKEALTNYIINKHRRKLQELERQGRQASMELLRRTIEERVRATVGVEETLMGKLISLKKCGGMEKQYSRFRKELQPFNRDFFKRIQAGSFLPNRAEVLS